MLVTGTSAAPDSRNHLSAMMGLDTVGRDHVVEMSNTRVLSLRSGDWKYIEPSDGPSMIQWGPKIETGNAPEPQLYNIKADIGERTNVAPAHPDIVARMQEILATERAASKK